MRSVGTFIALMATGIVIVLIYIRSGESIVALVLSFITLFAVLIIVQWKPWAISDGPGPSLTPRPSLLKPRPKGTAPIPTIEVGVWRSRFDITWDARGISGVRLGARAPQLWAWSQIDDIGQDLAPDPRGSDTAEATAGRPETGDGQPEPKAVFRLDFPDHRNPEQPDHALVCLGPEQSPDAVVAGARRAWRESKITRSRFHDLTLEERTRKMAEHFSATAVELRESGRSPELLFQELRRNLLTGGELRRLSTRAGFDDVLDAFDTMCEAHGLHPLTQDEADELAAIDGPDSVAALHRTLDWMAEERGARLVFLDREAEDYLLGLIPAGTADDWDGQTVGGGSTTISLDRPLGGRSAGTGPTGH